MKRRMILPLMAVLFALVGAFASAPLAQTAWFNDSGDVGQDEITVPTNKVCSTSGAIQCMIGSLPAYDTQLHAEQQDTDGLLKYTNN